MTIALIVKPDTRITSWAKDEAEARDAMIARGETPEYGMNYAQRQSGVSWEKAAVGEKPELVVME